MSKVKEKQNRRRVEILEKVIPILSEESFDDLSVSEICARIGISVGSFYHYFTKKTDLLGGFMVLIDDDIERKVVPLLTSEDEIENLRRFAHGWAEYVAEHGIERSKLISAIDPDGNGISETDRISLEVLREHIGRGQDRGQITREQDAEELASMFLLALRGVTVDWSRRGGSYAVTEKMDAVIGFYLRAFRACGCFS